MTGRMMVGVVSAGLVVALTGCGGDGEAPPSASPPPPAAPSSELDEAGQNACYLFLKWTEDATILDAEEMHDRVKEIWDGGSGFTGTSGAKDSSNAVIRNGARRMLEAEVAGDVEGLAAAGFRVGDECGRLAP